MADFRAQVRAEIDRSSLTTLVSDIQNSLNNARFNIQINNQNLQSIGQQMRQVGQNAGQQFTQAFESSLNNIHIKNGGLGNISRMLQGAGFDKQSISAITQELDRMVLTINKIQTSQLSNGNIRMKISGIDELNRAVTVVREFDKETGRVANTSKTFTQSFASASNSVRQYTSSISQASKEQLTLTRSSTLSNNMTSWLNNNARAAEVYGDRIRELQNTLRNNTSAGALQTVSAEFRNIQSEARAAGLTVSGFQVNMKNAIATALGIGSVHQVLNTTIKLVKDMVQEVISLDDAMTQFKIVTKDASVSYEEIYKNFNKLAKDLAVSQKDLIDSATVYSRLGYDADESSILSKYTAMLSRVGAVDISSAQDAITALTKAFDIGVSDIEVVMDRLVNVGRICCPAA